MVALAVPHLGGLSPHALGHAFLLIVVGLVALTVLGILVAVPLHRVQTRREVTSPGMWAVVGRMGGGKTFFMAWAGLKALAAGRTVFANFGLRGMVGFDAWDAAGRPDGAVVRVSNWAELIQAPEHTLCLVDELQLWWPSEAWRVPVPIAAWCSQLRKRRITMIWSAQDWQFVGKRVRRLTFGVWECRPFAGKSVYCQYPPAGFDQAFKSRTKRLARMVLRHSKAVRDFYDTREIVVGLSGFGEGFEGPVQVTGIRSDELAERRAMVLDEVGGSA